MKSSKVERCNSNNSKDLITWPEYQRHHSHLCSIKEDEGIFSADHHMTGMC